jgi:hypothetical protein
MLVISVDKGMHSKQQIALLLFQYSITLQFAAACAPTKAPTKFDLMCVTSTAQAAKSNMNENVTKSPRTAPGTNSQQKV